MFVTPERCLWMSEWVSESRLSFIFQVALLIESIYIYIYIHECDAHFKFSYQTFSIYKCYKRSSVKGIVVSGLSLSHIVNKNMKPHPSVGLRPIIVVAVSWPNHNRMQRKTKTVRQTWEEICDREMEKIEIYV